MLFLLSNKINTMQCDTRINKLQILIKMYLSYLFFFSFERMDKLRIKFYKWEKGPPTHIYEVLLKTLRLVKQKVFDASHFSLNAE